jgi:hypothetical protein
MEEVIGGPQHVEAILLGALCLLIPVGVRLREAGESEAQQPSPFRDVAWQRGAKCDATEKARLLATDQVSATESMSTSPRSPSLPNPEVATLVPTGSTVTGAYLREVSCCDGTDVPYQPPTSPTKTSTRDTAFDGFRPTDLSAAERHRRFGSDARWTG